MRTPEGPVEDLIMLPWTSAVAALADRPLRLRILTPPYPSVGAGMLRTLRVAPLGGALDGAWEIVAGYERYERTPG